MSTTVFKFIDDKHSEGFRMPYAKKRKTGRSSASTYGKRSGRQLSVPRAPRSKQFTRPGQRAVIPIVANFDYGLTTDPSMSFSFDQRGYYVNGAFNAIGGATELNSVWELMRIMKVEFTILPAANGLEYSAQSLSTGVTNIPYVYRAFDYNDPDNGRSLAQIMQNPTVHISRADRVQKFTLWPKIQGTSDVINTGIEDKNQFIQGTNSAGNTHWNGCVVYIDMVNEVWTYGSGRVVMKVFYECLQSR